MCEAPGDSRGRVRNAAAFRPAVLINARCRALARPKLFCGRPTLKGFSINPRLLPGFLDCSSFPEPLRLLSLAGAKATHLTFRPSPLRAFRGGLAPSHPPEGPHDYGHARDARQQGLCRLLHPAR